MRGADCSYGPYFSTDYSQQTHTYTHTHYKTVKIKHICIKFFFLQISGGTESKMLKEAV